MNPFTRFTRGFSSFRKNGDVQDVAIICTVFFGTIYTSYFLIYNNEKKKSEKNIK